MSEGDDDGAAAIDGLPIEEAVSVVVERGDAADAESARSALETISEDGVVGRSGVYAGLAETAKVVATPETRLELAGMALADAREAAPDVEERPLVGTRLEWFEDELDALESRVADLGGELSQLVGLRSDPDARLEVAQGIQELTEAANACQRAADELTGEIEGFEQWLAESGVRYDELAEDVAAFEGSLDELASVVDQLAATRDEHGTADPDANDVGRSWLDAAVERRVLGLVHADLRWELEELRAWVAAEGDDDGTGEEIADRLHELEARRGSLEDRLSGLALPEWEERFGQQLSALDEDLDAVEPPIEWSRVEVAIQDLSSRLDGQE